MVFRRADVPPLFIHPPVAGHFDRFPAWSIRSKAAVTIHAEVSYGRMLSFRSGKYQSGQGCGRHACLAFQETAERFPQAAARRACAGARGEHRERSGLFASGGGQSFLEGGSRVPPWF